MDTSASDGFPGPDGGVGKLPSDACEQETRCATPELLQASESASISISMTTTSGYAAGISAEIPTPSSRIRDRYLIRSLLGKGGFGAVYEAWDEVLQRIVAIKVARSDRFSETQGRQRFLDEARAAARLRHPQIITVFDSGTDEAGNPFVVFEYINGESLSERIRRQPLERKEAVALVATVAEAMHVAHKLGLVHRDLKPPNILLDKSGQPHVADFGLAVDEKSQREMAGEVAGSPQYMSPEQLRGETQYLDGRTDIWSLGVILYELLTKRRPFTGRDLLELKEEIRCREPKPLRQIDDSIPAELEQICLRCLRKPIVERYSTAADLATALRRFQSRENRVSRVPKPVLIGAGIGASCLIGAMLFFGNGTNPGKNGDEKPAVIETKSTDRAVVVESTQPTNLVPPVKAPAEPVSGEWFPVLKSAPKFLEWPVQSKNSRWELDAKQQEFWLSCDSRAMIATGKVLSGDYQIQGSLFQSPWTGQFGFFLGAHEIDDGGTPLRRVQIVELQCSQVGGRLQAKLQRFVEIQELTGARRVRSRQGFASATLPTMSSRDERLEISVSGGRLTRIQWGDHYVRDLIRPDADQFVNAADGYGEWGIFADSTTGIVRNLEFFLQPESVK